MKTKRLIIKTLSIFASFIFFFLLTTNSVKAIYNKDLNTIKEYKVNRTTGKVDMTIEYQYGVSEVEVYICNLNAGEQSCTNPGGSANKSKYVDANYSTPVINRYSELREYSPNLVLSAGISVSEFADKYDDNMKLDNRYTIMVKAKFCTTRTAETTGCLAWSNKDIILNDTFDLETGLTNSAEINNTIKQILNITHSIVIPVLWLLLGALLIIRGIILAIAIVKSSDEPDVRKQKINGLIWLVVGVVIGYVVTIAARIVMGMFGYGGYF